MLPLATITTITLRMLQVFSQLNPVRDSDGPAVSLALPSSNICKIVTYTVKLLKPKPESYITM